MTETLATKAADPTVALTKITKILETFEPDMRLRILHAVRILSGHGIMVTENQGEKTTVVDQG